MQEHLFKISRKVPVPRTACGIISPASIKPKKSGAVKYNSRLYRYVAGGEETLFATLWKDLNHESAYYIGFLHEESVFIGLPHWAIVAAHRRGRSLVPQHYYCANNRRNLRLQEVTNFWALYKEHGDALFHPPLNLNLQRKS